MGSPFSCTIPVRAAQKAISDWPRRFLQMNSANDKQRKALGKGLSALLPGRSQQSAPEVASATTPATASGATKPGTLPLNLIQPNPMQPRTVFSSDGLQ